MSVEITKFHQLPPQLAQKDQAVKVFVTGSHRNISRTPRAPKAISEITAQQNLQSIPQLTQCTKRVENDEANEEDQENQEGESAKSQWHRQLFDPGANKSATKVEAQQSLPAVPIDNAFVYDFTAYVRMKDIDTAISTLKSSLTFRNLDPSKLLYDELLDCLLDSETYANAYLIYSALVWVFDSEFAKNKGTKFVFPNSLDFLTQALQDASMQQIDCDGKWRRNLLVIKLFVYCLQRDFRACQQRSKIASDKGSWIGRTRISALLQADDFSAIPKRSMRNDWILQAIGWCLVLWKRIHDTTDSTFCKLERGDTCDAVLRLIEMLFECTTQVDNVVQRIYAGKYELLPGSQVLFMMTIQSYDLKLRLRAIEKRKVDRLRGPAAASALTAFEQLTLEINRMAQKQGLPGI